MTNCQVLAYLPIAIIIAGAIGIFGEPVRKPISAQGAKPKPALFSFGKKKDKKK